MERAAARFGAIGTGDDPQGEGFSGDFVQHRAIRAGIDGARQQRDPQRAIHDTAVA